MKPMIIVILGPTATGKSSLAVALAARFKGEIINADSMQVYRFMDIGTAKATEKERSGIRHHLIDIVNPDEQYTAGRFRKDAAGAIADITSRTHLPFVAGGTGLYIRVLTEGLFQGPAVDPAIREGLLEEARLYGNEHLHRELAKVDPASASAIHPNNVRRVIRALEVYLVARRPISALQKEQALTEPPYHALKIGLKKERALLYADIDRRVDEMIQEGLVEETESLLRAGYDEDCVAMGGLGYKESLEFIRGRVSLPEARRLIKRNTRHYARRQMTWFRKERKIKWFNPADEAGIIKAVEGHIKGSSFGES
ncbi:MAG: tRNA (adenosine(37)-N6)-dimethylallyltransferase MiaA [Thermodesulfobacteriota bacterium]